MLKVVQNLEKQTVSITDRSASDNKVHLFRDAELKFFFDLGFIEVHSKGEYVMILPVIYSWVTFEGVKKTR